MQLLTIHLKDRIIEKLINERVDSSTFSFSSDDWASTFGVNSGMILSFFKELEVDNLVRSVSITSDGSILGFTSTKLDTFYEQGGYTGFYSIKNLVESKLMYEVEQLLKQAEKDNKPDQIKRLKEIVSIGKDILSVGKFFVGD